MARNGSGVYSLPAGSVIANGDTSDAADLNVPLADLEADMNTPRPIVAGGTGATSASAARTALGLAIGTDVQAYDADLTAVAGLSSSGIIARTGAGTAAARTITGTAGLITVTNGDGVSGNPTLTIANGTEGQILRSGASTPAMDAQIVLGTAVNSTSGTSIDFTGIPSWARRVTVIFDGVSSNGTSPFQIQVGSGSFSTSGYAATASYGPSAGQFVSATSGFVLETTTIAAAVTTRQGALVLTRISSTRWIATGVNSSSQQLAVALGGSSPTLSGDLDRVRFTTVGGVDTFDAGTINISWE